MTTEISVITGTGMGTAVPRASQSACRPVARVRWTGASYAGLCAGLMVVLAVLSSAVSAQSNRAAAGSDATHGSYEALLDEAVSAFDAGDFARARKLFDRAYGLRPNSRVLRGMGIAALRLERYSEAYRTLTAALKHPVQPLTVNQRDEVTGLLSWMETSLGCVKLRWTPSEPDDYEVLVDGNVLHESTLWLAAGTHHLAVHAPGFGAIERSLTLVPEQHEVIELTLNKRAAPPVATKAARRAPSVTPADAAHSFPERETSRATAPQRSATSSSEARDSDPSSGGSVLTRWWFWTAVAAVAASGVATAVLLSSPAPTRSVDTSEGAVLVTVPSGGSR